MSDIKTIELKNAVKTENVEVNLKEEEPKNKNKERETWSGRFDFFLAALGYAGILN